jgi:His-Xaa-Ser system protein HxsD
MAKKENKIIISINPKLYSLEAVYGAAYAFLDKAYIYLEEGPKAKIQVILKGKEKLTKKGLQALKGEFLNELLNSSLRDKISKSNRKIREYIVARALVSASYEESFQEKGEGASEKDPLSIVIPWRDKRQEKCLEEKPAKEAVWKKDPQGIAIPWEEKYLTKKRCRKEKSK